MSPKTTVLPELNIPDPARISKLSAAPSAIVLVATLAFILEEMSALTRINPMTETNWIRLTFFNGQTLSPSCQTFQPRTSPGRAEKFLNLNSTIDGSPEVRACTQIFPLNFAFQTGGRLKEMAATSTIRQMEHDPVIRPTARVLMLDEFDRILLFRGQDPLKPEIRFWFPTGGGIEPGETPEEAARREVLEETGLANLVLGPHIWNRRHVFSFYGSTQDVREVWFFARVPTFDIDTSRFTEIERETVKEHRWWTQSELQTTTDVLTPRALAELVRDLLLNGLPQSPVDVPV